MSIRMCITAFWVAGTPVKFSVFTRAKYKFAAATWTSTRSKGFVLLDASIVYVFFVLPAVFSAWFDLCRNDCTVDGVDLPPCQAASFKLPNHRKYLAHIDNAGIFYFDFEVSPA